MNVGSVNDSATLCGVQCVGSGCDLKTFNPNLSEMSALAVLFSLLSSRLSPLASSVILSLSALFIWHIFRSQPVWLVYLRAFLLQISGCQSQERLKKSGLTHHWRAQVSGEGLRGRRQTHTHTYTWFNAEYICLKKPKKQKERHMHDFGNCSCKLMQWWRCHLSLFPLPPTQIQSGMDQNQIIRYMLLLCIYLHLPPLHLFSDWST